MYRFYLITFVEYTFGLREVFQVLVASKSFIKQYSAVTLYVPTYYGEYSAVPFRFRARSFRINNSTKILEVTPPEIMKFAYGIAKNDQRDEVRFAWRWICDQFLKDGLPKWLTHKCPITRHLASTFLDHPKGD